MAIRIDFKAVDNFSPVMEAAAKSPKKLADAMQKVAKENNILNRQVLAAIQKSIPPQEKFNQLVGKLDELYREGTISAQEHGRTLVTLRDRYEDVGESSDDAFRGDGLSQFVRNMGQAILAGRGIHEVLQSIQEERERILQFSQTDERSLSSLSQVASSKSDFQGLVSEAQKFFAEGAAETVEQGAAAVFALRSAGADSEIEVFRELAKSGTAQSTELLARAAQTVRSSFGEDVGRFEDVIDRAFAASRFAPATAEAITEAAARGAGSARALRFDPDELFAATALSAEASGTAERGGTRIASLLRSIEQLAGDSQKLRGDSLSATIDNIVAQKLDGNQLQTLFGRSEAVEGFRDVANNLDRFRDAVSQIDTADKTNLTRQQIGFSRVDPAIAATQALRSETNRREVTLEGRNIGIEQAAVQIQRTRADADLAKQLGPGFLPDIYRAAFRTLDAGFNAVGLRTGRSATEIGLQTFPTAEQLEIGRQQLQAQQDNTAALHRLADQPPQGPQQPPRRAPQQPVPLNRD